MLAAPSLHYGYLTSHLLAYSGSAKVKTLDALSPEPVVRSEAVVFVWHVSK